MRSARQAFVCAEYVSTGKFSPQPQVNASRWYRAGALKTLEQVLEPKSHRALAVAAEFVSALAWENVL